MAHLPECLTFSSYRNIKKFGPPHPKVASSTPIATPAPPPSTFDEFYCSKQLKLSSALPQKFQLFQVVNTENVQAFGRPHLKMASSTPIATHAPTSSSFDQFYWRKQLNICPTPPQKFQLFPVTENFKAFGPPHPKSGLLHPYSNTCTTTI